MIDIEFIRQNPDLVKTNNLNKGYPVDIDLLLKLDKKRRQLLSEVDNLRETKNSLNKSSKAKKPTQEEITKSKSLKDRLAKLEKELNQTQESYELLLKAVPNIALEGVPIGRSEDENVVVKSVGTIPSFDFPIRSHHDLGESNQLIDKKRAAKIAGSRFIYLLGDLVKLEFAIINFVIDQLTDKELIAKIIKNNHLNLTPKPFIAVLPPAMLRTAPYMASSRLNADDMTYKLEQDDLWLNASAEHTLCTMYMNEILDEQELPIRLIGFSTSFRREAGTYGKDMEGMIRLHQFDKLEMEVLSSPETGLNEHLLLVAIQEYLINQLKLPYQFIEKCTADIGKPNAKGVDMNCWFPAQNNYRETHTADYLTDYQSRGLKIRLRRNDKSLDYVHNNDATAFALSRIMAAIMENYQTKDGKINVPLVLRPYLNNKKQI